MAIAKEHAAQDSHMELLQACSFYGNVYGAAGGPSTDCLFGFQNHHHQIVPEEGESSDDTSGSESVKNFTFSRLPSLSGPTNSNSNSFVLPEEAQSVINFKSAYYNWGRPTASQSLLSFEQGNKINHQPEEFSIWADSMEKNNMWNQLNTKCSIESRLSEEDPNCYEMASDEGRVGWLYSGAVDAAESVHQQSGGSGESSHKRPFMGDEMQALKRQCTGESRKPKPKSTPAKDPQSIAAKNRRERISERLKILQDLVPNGAKVDLVTMLEKAISYVKFLQLQVKVLATDEFWPAQGGKVPEISQVKEAIDTILSSYRDTNSSSSPK
ncbi:hypothetical protein NE237_008137 [Protea cynaroides]|uniref:BHLH domain-containing protein n=1 Tax=Protea cynaroides TaxID=273540 RepID=A0A9Q0KQH8_9MAGN|nr:hypothetical protein NE237_008137 [Protea cynaroides]